MRNTMCPCHWVLRVSLFAGLLAAPARAMTLEEFRALADNRVAVRTSFGVRSARPLGAARIELVIGMSVTNACRKPDSYRVLSFEDGAYAYPKFVRPTKVAVRKEAEARGPKGCPFASFERTIVRLGLPSPMRAGKTYYVVAQGSGSLMVTGAHTAQGFVYQGAARPRQADNAVDLAVLGLRQVEPVGPRLVKLEFGPNFAPGAGSRLDAYTVKINGKAVAVTNLGRITRVDTYLPVGWPFRAIPMHEVFLELARAFKDGDRIEVVVARSVTLAANSASLAYSDTRSLSNSIKANQVGYLTDSPVKVAYLGRWMGSFPEKRNAASPALGFAAPPPFAVHEEKTGRKVFGGTARLAHRSGRLDEGVYKVDHSGENVYVLDFTGLREPGRYFVSVPQVGRSLSFAIGEGVYRKAFEVAAYGVFAQRCGIELGPPYSEWRRIACHRRGLVPTTQKRLEKHNIRDLPKHVVRSPAIQAYGGHHDAGDYNPRSHVDVAQTLMDAWEIAPRKFFDGQLNIPEKGNGIPDILDEAHWAMRLWIGLQDADGGVRHGTESNGDPNFIQTAELDPKGDYAYAKDAAASFTFAGVMAQASRIWRSLGRAKDAGDFLARGRRAYAWAAGHPSGKSGDARAYASAEMLLTMGEERFNADFLAACVWSKKPNAELEKYRHYDQSRAAWAYARCPRKAVDAKVRKATRDAIIRCADMFIRNARTMAYATIRHPWAPISWGTCVYQNHLPPVIWAHKLTGDPKYRLWMIRTCDNTLGANPLSRSFIVGLGTRTVRAPLHNSRYSHFGEVVRGMQVQGPNERGEGYRVAETAYPKLRRNFACLHTFVDCHFAIAMDEGTIPAQAKTMATFGLLLPDSK